MRDAEREIVEKNVATRKEILSLEKEQSEAEAIQASEVSIIQAERRRQAETYEIEQRRLVETSEIDKDRQLLFLVKDGRTVWVFNTSTGSGIPYEATNKNDPTKIEKGDAVTPSGLFEVTRERPEGWWEGDLGKIYRPKYFVGGIAIHGMTSVPNYPASHGCVRLSTQAMDFVWDTGLVPVGTPVWVHE